MAGPHTLAETERTVAERLAGLPIDGVHLDLVRAPEQLDAWLAAWPRDRVLSLGVVDGRNIWRTDLSLSWNHPLVARSEVFFRGVVNNVFNHQRMDSFNTTIQGPRDLPSLAAFNPFTTTPVEGVNWQKGPAFGQASGPGSYQSPREASFSVGFRF